MRRANKLRVWFEQEPPPMPKMTFAELIGVTPSYVSQLLRDFPPWPGRDIARRIGEVTGGFVRPDDLAGFDLEPETSSPGDSCGPSPP